MFLVTLSRETGFVIPRPKGNFAVFKLFGTGQNSFITCFNDWKYGDEYNCSQERSPNHNIFIKIFLQRSTKKYRIAAQSLEVFESDFKYMKNVYQSSKHC